MSEKYNTRQRASVLALFAEHPEECFSARNIIDNPQIQAGEATVYRVLSRLTDKGAVTRYAGDTGRGVTYRYVDNHTDVNHIHMKCTKCGSTICLDCPLLNEFTQHIDTEHSFSVDNGKTVIYGRCNHCR